MKLAAIISVLSLVVFVGQEPCEAKLVEFETADGGSLELGVKVDKSLAYDQNQQNILFMVAFKTKSNVTEYLQRITSDEFTNSLVARSSEQVKLARNFQELAREFCGPIKEFKVTLRQLLRLRQGFEYIIGLLSDSPVQTVSRSESQYKDVKFSASELDRNADDLLFAIFEHLKADDLLMKQNLKINNLPVENIIRDYIGILKSMNRGGSLEILKDALVGLSNKLVGC